MLNQRRLALRLLGLLAFAQLVILSLACGSSGTSSPAAAAEEEGIRIEHVTFGTVMVNYQIAHAVDHFAPTDMVNASIQIHGRPRSGVVTIAWPLARSTPTATVDLASANGGIVFSVGQSTYVGSTLTHESPLLIGSYEMIVSTEGRELGRYPYRVLPPPGAIATTLRTIVTSRGTDANLRPIDVTTQFTTGDIVYLVTCGDFGQYSWVRADWGGLDIPLDERIFETAQNSPDSCIAFHVRPNGGWAPGAYEVTLTMNGVRINSYPFTVEASATALIP